MSISKILGSILRELYSIQRNSLEIRVASAEKLRVALYNWRSEIAHFLDLDPSALSPLYKRQHLALRLSYSHAFISLHRPFLLDSFDDHLDVAAPSLRARLKENVIGCLDAALDIMKIIDTMYKADTAINASWVS